MTEKQIFTLKIPQGDDRTRLVCDRCDWVHYENPKAIVGSVVEAVVDGRSKILLCRRAIEPRHGFWTIPAGFMEEQETIEEGAKREAYEEARAQIDINALLATYSIPRISQVQIIFRATLTDMNFSAGSESLEVALFAWDEIPWSDLAFPSVHWALRHFDAVRDRNGFPPFQNPPGEDGRNLPPGL